VLNENLDQRETEMSNENSQEVEEAVAKNNEEWQKKLLLLVMTMIVALLGLD
jgi:hypothetical protein